VISTWSGYFLAAPWADHQVSLLVSCLATPLAVDLQELVSLSEIVLGRPLPNNINQLITV
jgi:hypothetical protein